MPPIATVERAERDQQATNHAVAVLAAALEADRRVDEAAEQDQGADAVDADRDRVRPVVRVDRIPAVVRARRARSIGALQTVLTETAVTSRATPGANFPIRSGKQVELAEREEADDEHRAGQVIGRASGAFHPAVSPITSAAAAIPNMAKATIQAMRSGRGSAAEHHGRSRPRSRTRSRQREQAGEPRRASERSNGHNRAEFT